jgi:hypothetical protein
VPFPCLHDNTKPKRRRRCPAKPQVHRVIARIPSSGRASARLVCALGTGEANSRAGSAQVAHGNAEMSEQFQPGQPPEPPPVRSFDTRVPSETCWHRVCFGHVMQFGHCLTLAALHVAALHIAVEANAADDSRTRDMYSTNQQAIPERPEDTGAGGTISLDQGADPAPKPPKYPNARSMYSNNPLAFGLQVAPIGGPVGLLGLTADIAVLPELSVTGGAGMGTGGSLFQYAIAIRPRIPIRPHIALDLTAGISRGDYDRLVELDLAGQGQSELYRGCTWVNVDFGPELRFSSHVLLRPFFGISKLVASDTPQWVGDSYDKENRSVRWPTLAYFGLDVGYYGGFD